ncbi:IS200/IS605 family transposase [uncultured Dubosiella sp.]|uniref:IS200/IS605 family transposase n=1 Tax=uncultured Dubosiella sp. TaxID=1937011 RepID=UPI00263A1DF0|nr:IS200/IS605 family transposase [uncultured Dubosiella sp.]
MKENIIYERTCVYNINYHVVFSTKYRQKVLTPEIEDFLQATAQEIAQEKGFTIHQFEVEEADHIHAFVSAPPKVSVSYIVKMLKGILARKAFMEFPELKTRLRKGALWNHSTYIETIGSVSEENIRRYIEKQKNCY